MADEPSHQSEENNAVEEGEKEAVETAQAELKKSMAEIVENPPTEPPPPTSVVTEEINYEDPLPDPYNKAITYLEQHNILQMFQSMTANIVYQKPDNPLDFMISEVAELKKLEQIRKAAKKSKK